MTLTLKSTWDFRKTLLILPMLLFCKLFVLSRVESPKPDQFFAILLCLGLCQSCLVSTAQIVKSRSSGQITHIATYRPMSCNFYLTLLVLTNYNFCIPEYIESRFFRSQHEKFPGGKLPDPLLLIVLLHYHHVPDQCQKGGLSNFPTWWRGVTSFSHE